MVKIRILILISLILGASFFIFRQKITDSKLDFLSPKKTGHIKLQENKAKIGLVGDLGLGRVITATARSKNDFNWSFSEVSGWLKLNDFNLANLESPIINNCPTANNTTFIFCGDPKFLPILNENKFIFTLSNNHILNYSQKGLMETQEYLNLNNIKFVYSHQLNTEFNTASVNNISFGFLGFDLTGNHHYDKENILSLVEKYDPKVDWLIVSLHWGNEYLAKPENWRVELAHNLVDRGADIIHGHHPHVLQPMEIYKDKLIFYSLGNFIFDQNWSISTSTSEMVSLTLSKNEIKDINKTPIIIRQNSRPEVVLPKPQPASLQ